MSVCTALTQNIYFLILFTCAYSQVVQLFFELKEICHTHGTARQKMAKMVNCEGLHGSESRKSTLVSFKMLFVLRSILGIFYMKIFHDFTMYKYFY